VYPKSLTKGISKAFASWQADARNLEISHK
jgi:hypothetical protein